MWKKFVAEFKEKVWDHEQVVKLRHKFAELDAQTQSYILIGVFGAFVLILSLSFIGFLVKTSSLRTELALMEDQIKFVQSSVAKIEELKAQARTRNTEPLLRDLESDLDLNTLTDKIVQKALIPKANAEVGDAKANALEVKLNKISLRQLVRVLYMLEESQANTVVEKINIDSREDKEGYIWVVLGIKKFPAKAGA